MANKNNKSIPFSPFRYLGLLALLFLFGCASPKAKYRKEYARVWKQLIQSQAWRDALAKNTNEEELLVLNEPGSFKGIESSWFLESYNSLVSRAYFKIITEAKNADKKLRDDHAYWTAKSKASTTKDKELEKKVAQINKKYNAHKKMLLGLKSWNIFNEDRSGDLQYFKAENQEAIYKMYLQGLEKKKMVSYLVFKLADLYHFEE